MLTEKDYCDYDTQKLLMNLGFPMQAQSYDLGKDVKEYLPKIHLYEAQKWLREVKNISVLVGYDKLYGSNEVQYDCVITNEHIDLPSDIFYSSYEEALLEGIKEAIKILKNQ